MGSAQKDHLNRITLESIMQKIWRTVETDSPVDGPVAVISTGEPATVITFRVADPATGGKPRLRASTQLLFTSQAGEQILISSQCRPFQMRGCRLPTAGIGLGIDANGVSGRQIELLTGENRDLISRTFRLFILRLNDIINLKLLFRHFD